MLEYGSFSGQFSPTIRRNLSDKRLAVRTDTSAILMYGARQVGKSTIVPKIASGKFPNRCLSLDEHIILVTKLSDPDGYVRTHDGSVVIDKNQRVTVRYERSKQMCIKIDRHLSNRLGIPNDGQTVSPMQLRITTRYQNIVTSSNQGYEGSFRCLKLV